LSFLVKQDALRSLLARRSLDARRVRLYIRFMIF